MSGNTQIDQIISAKNGAYSFSKKVAPGTYNLVAEKNGVTQTTVLTVTTGNITNADITLSAKNVSAVVEVKNGSVPVTVGNLDKVAEDEADKDNKKTEIKLIAEIKGADSADDDQKKIDEAAGDSTKLFLAVKITKTTEDSVSAIYSTDM